MAADLISEGLPGGMHLYDSAQGSWDCSRLVAVAAGLIEYGLRGPVTPGDLYRILTEGNTNGD